jgi:hypothetical protein
MSGNGRRPAAPLSEHVEEIYSDGREGEVFADWRRRHPNARILSWIALARPSPFRHAWRIVYRDGGMIDG